MPPDSDTPVRFARAPDALGATAAIALAAWGSWQSAHVAWRTFGLTGSSVGECAWLLSVIGCTLLFWKSAARFFLTVTPLWQTRQFCSGT